MFEIHIADLGIYNFAQILFQALDTRVKIQYLRCMSIVNIMIVLLIVFSTKDLKL